MRDPSAGLNGMTSFFVFLFFSLRQSASKSSKPGDRTICTLEGSLFKQHTWEEANYLPPKSKNICKRVFNHIAISALMSLTCIRYAPAINETVRAVRSFNCPTETDWRGQPLTKSFPDSTHERERGRPLHFLIIKQHKRNWLWETSGYKMYRCADTFI